MLWNPAFHYHFYNILKLILIPNHNYPIHTSHSYCLKINSNITLPSKPTYSKWSLYLRFHYQIPVHASRLHRLPSCSHSSWFDQLKIICWGVKVINLLTKHFLPILWYVVPLRPKCLPRLPVLRHPQFTSLLTYAHKSEYLLNDIRQIVQAAFAGHFACKRAVNISWSESYCCTSAEFFAFKFSLEEFSDTWEFNFGFGGTLNNSIWCKFWLHQENLYPPALVRKYNREDFLWTESVCGKEQRRWHMRVQLAE